MNELLEKNKKQEEIINQQAISNEETQKLNNELEEKNKRLETANRGFKAQNQKTLQILAKTKTGKQSNSSIL